MKKKIIPIILIIWIIIFLVDIICAFTISHPVFMLEASGGERTDYYGLGYSMTHYYSWFGDGGVSFNPLIYLIANGFILTVLLRKKIFRK